MRISIATMLNLWEILELDGGSLRFIMTFKGVSILRRAENNIFVYSPPVFTAVVSPV